MHDDGELSAAASGRSGGPSRRSLLLASLAAATGLTVAELGGLVNGDAARAAIAYQYPTSPFRPGMEPGQLYNAPRENGRRHLGRDINWSREVEPIYSVADGTVIERYANTGGFGFYVDIRNDDGVRFRYAHLASSAFFGGGARVNAGTRIGTMGGTGFGRENYYARHLHLECRPNGSSDQTIDPVPFLDERVGGTPTPPAPSPRFDSEEEPDVYFKRLASGEVAVFGADFRDSVGGPGGRHIFANQAEYERWREVVRFSNEQIDLKGLDQRGKRFLPPAVVGDVVGLDENNWRTVCAVFGV